MSMDGPGGEDCLSTSVCAPNVSRYSYKTLMGNWIEKKDLSEARLKDYLEKKENRELMIYEAEARKRRTAGAVSLESQADDGIVEFGDIVMLYSEGSQCVMATDPYDILKSATLSFAVTTTSNKEPCTRNTVRLVPYNSKDGGRIRYGQHFMITTHHALDAKMFLHSVAYSPMHRARYQSHQEVSFCEKPAWNTAWKFEYADPNKRLEMEGSYVMSGQPLIIKHAATNMNLCGNNTRYRNDFGFEFEVTCYTLFDQHKLEDVSNHWTVIDKQLLEAAAAQAEADRQTRLDREKEATAS